ncbi:hypothetical protein ACFL96_06405 [Thermoproteota archaeon]
MMKNYMNDTKGSALVVVLFLIFVMAFFAGNYFKGVIADARSVESITKEAKATEGAYYGLKVIHDAINKGSSSISEGDTVLVSSLPGQEDTTFTFNSMENDGIIDKIEVIGRSGGSQKKVIARFVNANAAHCVNARNLRTDGDMVIDVTVDQDQGQGGTNPAIRVNEHIMADLGDIVEFPDEEGQFITGMGPNFPEMIDVEEEAFRSTYEALMTDIDAMSNAEVVNVEVTEALPNDTYYINPTDYSEDIVAYYITRGDSYPGGDLKIDVTEEVFPGSGRVLAVVSPDADIRLKTYAGGNGAVVAPEDKNSIIAVTHRRAISVQNTSPQVDEATSELVLLAYDDGGSVDIDFSNPIFASKAPVLNIPIHISAEDLCITQKPGLEWTILGFGQVEVSGFGIGNFMINNGVLVSGTERWLSIDQGQAFAQAFREDEEMAFPETGGTGGTGGSTYTGGTGVPAP